MNARPRPDLRIPLVVMTVAAAGLLVLASFSKSWVVNDGRGDMGFGPTGMRGCLIGVACHITSNGDAIDWLRDKKNRDIIRVARGPVPKGEPEPSASGWFPALGYLAFAANMLGAVGLLVTAGLAFRRERPVLPFSPPRFALGALVIALLTSVLFVASKPGWPEMLSVGWGFWIFAIGILPGLAGAQQLAKLIRAPDPLDALIAGHEST